MKRLRQLVLSGDVYSESAQICYNYQDPAGLETAQEHQEFLQRLQREG